MNVDCHWIEENLERLAFEDDRLAQGHLAVCAHCREQIESLRAIDPMVKQVFEYDLAIARSPKRRRSPVLIGAFGTAIAAALLLIVAQVRQPASTPGTPAPPAMTSKIPAPEPATSPKIQNPGAVTGRAKPEATVPDRPSSVPREARQADRQAPEFLVTDLAGYSRTLNDYRGYVLIFGVWDSKDPQTAANLERVYKSVSANTKIRVLGISEDREVKPANTTFPSAVNQGSQLLGGKAGDIVVVDANGTIAFRGSLRDESSRLLRSVQSALTALGIQK